MNRFGLSRRLAIHRGLAAMVAGSFCTVARASVADWMPYRADQIVRIDPSLSDAGNGTAGMRRIEPLLSDFRPSREARHRLNAPMAAGREPINPPPLREQPPKAYAVTAQRFGVPAWLMFGVALQESKIRFGERVLPYPWTLCVQGQGRRFSSYEQTLRALREVVARGVVNVDCGAMQVNWRWHKDKLGTPERALDPYPNLATGASILRGHFNRHGDWRRAVALYHTGAEDTAEKRARGARYAQAALTRLSRLGVDIRPWTNGGELA